MKNMNETNKLFENYSRDFKPFFETRLNAKLLKQKEEKQVTTLYNSAFKKVMFSGFAAVAAILLVIFMLNGTLNLDALMGVKDLTIEQSLALTIAEL